MKEKLTHLFRTGFFHIFGSSVVNKILVFLSNVVLVRILTKAEYGVFTCAWNLYSLVLLANGLGVESGLLQLCSERSGDTAFADRMRCYAARIGMGVDVILAVLLAGIGLFIPLTIPAANSLVVLLSFLPMLQLIFMLTSASLRAQKRNQDFSRYTVINTAAILLCTALGACLFRETGMVLGYYAAYTISALTGFGIMKIRLFDHQLKPDREDRKALRSISLVSMCNNGLSQMMYLIDIFVLGLVAAEETTLASYKVATTIPSALAFIPLALITYLYPYFAEHRRDGKWCLRQYKRILLGLGCFNLMVSAGMVICAPLIIRIFYGEAYLDAVTVFRILSVNYFFSGTFRILSGNLLVTQRKIRFNFWVALISGSVNVIADWIFIQRWQSVGAAFATGLVVLVSSILSTTYLIRTFRKHTDGSG